MIAFDHRGHGQSDVPSAAAYGLDHLASDLDSVLEATLAPSERAVLAGHSMGSITITTWSDATATRSGSAPIRVLMNTTTGELLRKVRLLPVPRSLPGPSASRGGP